MIKYTVTNIFFTVKLSRNPLMQIKKIHIDYLIAIQAQIFALNFNNNGAILTKFSTDLTCFG